MIERALMVGLGELLWDFLPTGRTLGGAPSNFAYMSNLLGNEGTAVSRVGTDELGIEAGLQMKALGLNTTYIQQDDVRATGSARVKVDSDGQPIFQIKEDVAWDYLEWTSELEELSSSADVVCFGTLAQRCRFSAATIERFLNNTSEAALHICDVNLRGDFFTTDVIRRSFQFADIVKLNDWELETTAALLHLGEGEAKSHAKRILEMFELRMVCITRGARGSLLISGDEEAEHYGIEVKVADAVGSGDAFTACIANDYLRGRTIAEMSESANRFASWVATQVGATPQVHKGHLHEILG